MPRPMTPDQVAQELRHIAARLARSKNPSRAAVAKEVRRIMTGLKVGASRLMTSGGEDPEMGELFGQKALEAKVKTYLKSVHDLFGTEFSIREIDMGDDGSGRAVFEYEVPEEPEPKSFVLDWSPTETYSDFLAKLNSEIFGWETAGEEEGTEQVEEGQAQGQAQQEAQEAPQAMPPPAPPQA